MSEAMHEEIDKATMEDKFAVVKVDDNVFEGRYPLQPIIEGNRGTYGGEFVSQGLVAAWETVAEGQTPNSLHSYFLKAGNSDSVIRWVVHKQSDGRNFANRLVQGYQKATNALCFSMIVSFTRNNNDHKKKVAYHKLLEAGDEEALVKTPVPYTWSLEPSEYFHKYKDNLDALMVIPHTHDRIIAGIPPEFFQDDEEPPALASGQRQLGAFVKINDNVHGSRDAYRANFVDLAYISDSFYLSSMMRAAGVAYDRETFNFFRVSLDHTIYFHDDNYDASQWMYMDYRFSRLANNRILCQVLLFTLDKHLVASFVQEGLVFVPKKLADRANGGLYKL